LGPDWPDQLLAGEFPTGIYDLRLARECVNVETACDNLAFTVDSVFGWWDIEGAKLYPQAETLALIAEIQSPEKLAAWRKESQRLANFTGLSVTLHRLPPGTTKWNKPSLRLFSFTSSHWSGTAPKDHETVGKLIGHKDEVRTMAVGLRLDHSRYAEPSVILEGKNNFNLETTWNLAFQPEFGEDNEAHDRLAAAI
jgi:hypothetical protein